METEMAVFKARTISSKPAGTGAAIQPSKCYYTHTFLLNTGFHLIWDHETQL